ncbi:MAG: hypothetical protein ACOX8A_09920 [Thermacetogeniaceae bacterium]
MVMEQALGAKGPVQAEAAEALAEAPAEEEEKADPVPAEGEAR